MNRVEFDKNSEVFHLKGADRLSGLYFPIAGEAGLKAAITPDLTGDSKLDQNHFLLEPTSVEDLVDRRSSRSVWVRSDKFLWSVSGHSASQQADFDSDDADEVTVSGGYMWHEVVRQSKKYGITARVLNFVPVNQNVEIMKVTICNDSDADMDIDATAAIPMYSRSADNIRDHRHVTSLLNVIEVEERGIINTPTLSFDERGHRTGDSRYYVFGLDENGSAPVSFFPVLDDFCGDGGNLERPKALINGDNQVGIGTKICGQEAIGAFTFAKTTLKAGSSVSYVIYIGVTDRDDDMTDILGGITPDKVDGLLEDTKNYWHGLINVEYGTGDPDFNQYMRWISFQPELRRVYGCSFLPHHDYGKGGRGWRDLWQDCLALLLMNPDGVRNMLISNYGGVRIDGSNATIIGSKPGEFKADRNSITRVWMDHGLWPLVTTKLYIDQTGDMDILDVETAYFKDAQIMRGSERDLEKIDGTLQMTADNKAYKGTILEHLLVQNLCAFWEAGEHNHMRLRDADWNDALDMAGKSGESVAFTNGYAMNLLNLADILEKRGDREYEILESLQMLLTDDKALYESIDGKNNLLYKYMNECRHFVTGDKVRVDSKTLISSLRHKGEWIQEHIRDNEWIADGDKGWFNGYYDNDGNALEKIENNKKNMMLTSQVFAVMGGTATDAQVASITKSADELLYDKDCGGYRLNTDFDEVKLNMGRMFGFAFGEKENGAVFSHMAVMYANALYSRGFVNEGSKALMTLYEHSMDFENSRIYPGIPEYFGRRGRGLYHYLTGAASWYMLTVINQMFGVRGAYGDLIVEPKLTPDQYDEEGRCEITLNFRGKRYRIVLVNEGRKSYGDYRISQASLDGEDKPIIDNLPRLDMATQDSLSAEEVHELVITMA